MSATMTAISPAAAFTSSDSYLFKRPRTWFLILAIILITVGTGGFGEQVSPGHLYATSTHTTESGGVYLLITCLTSALCLALMARWFHPIVKTMMNQKVVLAFPVLALASTLWSSTPEMTFRKAALLALSFAFGWFLATAYTPSDQIRLLLVAGVILGIASIPIAVLLPRYGQDAVAGGWKGVFSQKNILGFTVFFLFSGLPFRRVPSLRKLLVLMVQAILPIGLILLSQSKESLVVAVVTVGFRLVGPVITSRRREQLPSVIYAIAFAMAAIVVSNHLVLQLLHRDATLSGRTREWAVLTPYAFKHIWGGYGYQAFWNGSADSFHAMHALKGSIHGSDNGYLDTALQFGLVGLALWVALLFVSLRDMARASCNRSLPLAAYWYAGLIISIFILAFFGGATLAPGNFATVMLPFSCAGLSNMSRGERVVSR